MSAIVDPVPNEPDTRDNALDYRNVVVTIARDVTGNGVVDIYDAIKLSNAFLSVPGDSNWNENADINSDDAVDIYDAIILSNNFLKNAWCSANQKTALVVPVQKTRTRRYDFRCAHSVSRSIDRARTLRSS